MQTEASCGNTVLACHLTERVAEKTNAVHRSSTCVFSPADVIYDDDYVWLIGRNLDKVIVAVLKYNY